MKASNRNFENLSRVGSINGRNRFTVNTANSNEIGIAVTQSGSKKATTLELVVPVGRSYKGSRRAGHLMLNGRQMRELYESLREVYENGLVNNG